MMKRFVFLFAIFVCGAAFADVKGQLIVDGKAVITPKNAAAYPVRDQNNARAWRIEVVLAEGTVDTSQLADEVDPHVNVINQSGVTSGNYILLWVSTDGKVSMNGTLSQTMTQYVDTTDGGDLKAELTTNTQDRVAGRVFTLKPVKTLSENVYQVDVTFDVAVTKRTQGTKLPADGGDAGKVFNSLYQAVQKKDVNGIKAGISPGVHSMLFKDYNTPEENLSSAVDILSAWLPKKNVKVAGGEVRGDAVLLEVEGEIYEGRNALYIVKMVKSDSGWGLEQVAPAGMFRK
ncbi:hypothetical protein L0222_21355 [bacterium]|nr:hypothetical protein [bacterium]